MFILNIFNYEGLKLVKIEISKFLNLSTHVVNSKWHVFEIIFRLRFKRIIYVLLGSARVDPIIEKCPVFFVFSLICI